MSQSVDWDFFWKRMAQLFTGWNLLYQKWKCLKAQHVFLNLGWLMPLCLLHEAHQASRPQWSYATPAKASPLLSHFLLFLKCCEDNSRALLSKSVPTFAGELEHCSSGELLNEDWWNIVVFRWSFPVGARRIMDAVKDGPKSTLNSGKMVALAAGLSVGATVGYIVYRHMSSTKTSEYHWEGSEIFTLSVSLGSLVIYAVTSRSRIQYRDVEDDASFRGL